MSAGPHSYKKGIPVLLILRNLLKVAKNKKEVQALLNSGKIFIDGKIRKDVGFPIGLMDIISLPSFTAWSEGQLIGTVLCGHDGRRGYIHHLMVHPDHRRKGLGQSLVSRCMFALTRIGIQKVHLFVFEAALKP